MATTQSPKDLLADLQAAQTSQPLSILHLAEPILETRHQQPPPENHSPSQTRPSNASTASSSVQHALTPSTLAADLQHYKDLFSKLRFSYLEQVTKEKYLRSIVGDPPVLVTPADNAELEQRLVGMKRELKAKKEECDALVREMEEVAREVAVKYEAVNGGAAELERLPAEIQRLQQELAEVKAGLAEKREALGGDDDDAIANPRMQMGLEATQAALEERRLENQRLDEEIEELESRMPLKMRECERAERELEEMERRRNEVTRQARDVKRIREEGGRDLLGERGKWYKAQETVMRGLLEA